MDILDYIYYDETSKTMFRWKKQMGPRRAGDVAGHVCTTSGYAIVTLRGVRHPVQYLVWRVFDRDMEEGKILDHIDGNRSNNHINNLRLCTHAENNWNKTVTSRSTTGVKGLTRHKKEGRWYGTITVNGFTYRKKSKDRQVVEDWLREKRKELHGEFCRE